MSETTERDLGRLEGKLDFIISEQHSLRSELKEFRRCANDERNQLRDDFDKIRGQWTEQLGERVGEKRVIAQFASLVSAIVATVVAGAVHWLNSRGG